MSEVVIPVRWLPCVAERMRVLIVAGIATGAIVAGVGSRLAMLLLRVTSPDRVRGIRSDDGFTIGQVTLGGTYSLVTLGAAVGIVGAGAYRLVDGWLIGPSWFRRLTTGLASGAVVGSMLIHADGVDFTALKPTWLAVGVFVALPALFGTVIGVAVDAVGGSDSWTSQGRRRWVLPLVLIACFPATLFVVASMLLFVGLWALLRDVDVSAEVRRAPAIGWAIRTAWMVVAVIGLVALVNDIAALS